ncbi:DedA family protein [Ktedonosporobacter rubrisoli]|uniref:DedA family protein n=2 Tax=Ktedonosporobacter rubrisoli TaxID=2509675 RepID=A0A4P6K6H1_KTERU|nr:DedA family protein [Ktedonosporobacter rubrisoli]
MAIESCCIPLPSEIVMPLAGIMIANGKLLPGINPILALVLVALSGAIGCLVGSMAAYGIGYKGGRPLMLKYGRYVLISQHDADLADKFFQRWGSPTAFFSRFLPVVRTYISLPAGISKMPFAKFCIYSFLGSFPFCFALAYVGTILGHNLEALSSVFHGLDVFVIIGLVILIALYIWRHVRNDRKARAEHAAAEAQNASQPQQPMQAQQPQQFTAQPQWGQPSQPQQQAQWGQQAGPQQFMGQPQWGQPSQQQQPSPAQWGQQPQQPQFPTQPQVGNQPQQPQFPGQPQWGQQPQQPQQPQFPSPAQWGQQQSQQSFPPSWPPAQADDDRTVYRP